MAEAVSIELTGIWNPAKGVPRPKRTTMQCPKARKTVRW